MKWKEQPCWSCAKATGQCIWSKSKAQKPVPGWDAEEYLLPKYRGIRVKSYKILHCPQYKHDGKSVLNWEGEMERYYESSGVNS